MSHQTRSDEAGDGPTDGTEGRPHRAGAFDVRYFIGALLGLYGVILLLTSLLSTSEADLERAGGVDVNLWTGLGLLASAAVFAGWARLRPVVVPPQPESDGGEDARAEADGTDGPGSTDAQDRTGGR